MAGRNAAEGFCFHRDGLPVDFWVFEKNYKNSENCIDKRDGIVYNNQAG